MGKGNDPNCAAGAAGGYEPDPSGAPDIPTEQQRRDAIARAKIVLRLLNQPEFENLDLTGDPDDRRVRDAADHARDAAAALYTSKLASEMRLALLLLERRLRRLALCVANCTQPREVATALRDLLMKPGYTAAYRQQILDEFCHSPPTSPATIITDWQRQQLRHWPATPTGPLYDAASPPHQGALVDHAMMAYVQLQDIRARLTSQCSQSATESGRTLCALYLSRIDQEMHEIRTQILFAADLTDHPHLPRPARIHTASEDLRSLRAAAEMVIRQFGRGREQVALIGQAERTAELLKDVIEDTAGVGRPTANFLPTWNRDEFEAMFPAQVDPDQVHGAYFPNLRTVVLSPGHAQMLCNPDADIDREEHGDLLLPVHLHELAHATARNSFWAVRDPVESALGEAYAEEIRELAVEAAQDRLSDTQGRSVQYAESHIYPTERAMLKEIFSTLPSSGPRQLTLRDLSSSGRMTDVLAVRICGPDVPIGEAHRRVHAALTEFLGGNRAPLRALLAQQRGAGVPISAEAA